MGPDRTRARAIQAEHAGRGDALGWFDALYREAAGNPAVIPWADLAPNPQLIDWLRRTGTVLADRTCLIVGCGLGDDAEALAAAGGRVSAFDLSETAIRWCGRRFPESRVAYRAANVLAPPAEWTRHFAFVFEANTLQSLPAELRVTAMEHVARFVAPGGTLLVDCRGRDQDQIVDGPPWPLSREELDAFARLGLSPHGFDDVIEPGEERVRRFVAEYRRPLKP